MGTTLPLNEKDGEISLSRLGERRVSSLESLKNNGIFQKFDETEWNDGRESLKKSLYLQKSSGVHSFLLVPRESMLDSHAMGLNQKSFNWTMRLLETPLISL